MKVEEKTDKLAHLKQSVYPHAEIIRGIYKIKYHTKKLLAYIKQQLKSGTMHGIMCT